MKIAYAAPMRLPTEKAHGIQIMETCAALAKAGDTIDLLVTRLRDADPFTHYDISPNLFRITKISSPDTVQYGTMGFFVHSLVFALGAVRYARKSCADIFYTRDPLCMLVAVSLLDIPVVWEVHSAHARIPSWALSRVAGVVAITRGLADLFRERGVPTNLIALAPDAVALDKFVSTAAGKDKADIKKRFNLPLDRPVALYVGSFKVYAWKGVDVVQAAAALAPEIEWVLAGGSEEECASMQATASKNLTFIPRLGRTDVPLLLAAADVLLLPNKKGDAASERDTSPMKLFEYMAMGIPIVASDLPSLREVLGEDSAYFAEPNSAASLAATARHVLAEHSAAREKAKRARQQVEKYTWDARARAIQNLLNRLTRRDV